MNLNKIKEDIEVASIDYYDRYTIEYNYRRFIQWVVRDKITGVDKVKSVYNDVSELPKAARKYRNAVEVWIDIYGVDKSQHLEMAHTIIDKLNIEKDYPYFEKPIYFDWGRFFRIKYTLYEPEVLAAPKRTK